MHRDAGSLRAELMLSYIMQIKYFCLLLADNTYFLTECVGSVCQSNLPYLLHSLLFAPSLIHLCAVNNFYIHHCPVQLSHFLAPLPFSCFVFLVVLWLVSSTGEYAISLNYHKLDYTTLQLAQSNMAKIHNTILIQIFFSDISTIWQM